MERCRICQDRKINDSCGFGGCAALSGPPLKTEIFPEHVLGLVHECAGHFPASREEPVAAEGSGKGRLDEEQEMEEPLLEKRVL